MTAMRQHLEERIAYPQPWSDLTGSAAMLSAFSTAFDITHKMREAGRPAASPCSSAEPRRANSASPRASAVGEAVPGDREASAFADQVASAIKRIAPFADVIPARHITELSTGDKAMGVAWRAGLRHMIAWAVDFIPTPVGIARHEAVHDSEGEAAA